MKDTIIKEKVLNHPIDKVWNAITNADEISSWFLQTNFKAEKGFSYVFNSKEENCEPIFGEVLSANPYHLVYTWTVTGTSVNTKVSWLLEEVENGTKLHLEHSGISNYEGTNAIEMFNSFDGGWDNCLSGLTNYLMSLINAG